MSLTKPPFGFFGRLRSLPNLTRIHWASGAQPTKNSDQTKAPAFPWKPDPWDDWDEFTYIFVDVYGKCRYNIPPQFVRFFTNQSVSFFLFFFSGGFGTTCTHSLQYPIFRIQWDDWTKIPTNWFYKNQSNVGKYTSPISHTWIVGVPYFKQNHDVDSGSQHGVCHVITWVSTQKNWVETRKITKGFDITWQSLGSWLQIHV